jgi:hypothetical protein
MSVPNEEYSYLAMACAKKDWAAARLLLTAEIGIDDDDHVLPGFRCDRRSTLRLLIYCRAPLDVFDVYFERRPNAKWVPVGLYDRDPALLEYLLGRGAVCANGIHLLLLTCAMGPFIDDQERGSKVRRLIEIVMRHGADPRFHHVSENANTYEYLEGYIKYNTSSHVTGYRFVYSALRRMEAMAVLASGRTLARNARSVLGRVPEEVLRRIHEMVEFDVPSDSQNRSKWISSEPRRM